MCVVTNFNSRRVQVTDFFPYQASAALKNRVRCVVMGEKSKAEEIIKSRRQWLQVAREHTERLKKEALAEGDAQFV